MAFIHKNLGKILISILLFTFYFVLGKLVQINNISTDYQLHTEYIQRINSGNAQYPGVFLLYLLVNIFSLFSHDKEVLMSTLILIISIAFAFRSYLTFGYFEDIANTKTKSFFTLLLAIYFPISMVYFYNPQYYYFGSFSPNVFHNSTITLVFPFTLLIFFLQLQYWEKPNSKTLALLTSVLVLSLFIKPSFFFVYLAVTPLFSLAKFKISRTLFHSMVPIFAGIGVMVLQTILIYVLNQGSFYEGKSGIAFKPFAYWTIVFPTFMFPISMLGSYLFVGVYLLFALCKKPSIEILYCSAMVIVSILIFALVIETGPRMNHGNFYWQVVPAYYLLLIVVVKDWIIRYKAKTIPFIFSCVLFLLFLAHAGSGFFYLYRFFILKSYS